MIFVSTGFSQTKYKGEKGVSSVGILAGHAVDSKAFTIGLDYRYNILDHVRLAPSVLYVLENKGLSTWYADADAHYLARITKETTLYPIVGVGLSVWNWKYLNPLLPLLPDEDGDVQEEETESHVRLGLNLGVGIER
jgi:opacity protein-like surface antigen